MQVLNRVRKQALLAGAAVLVLGGSAIGASVAAAQATPTPQATPPAGQSRQAREERFLTSLAAKLGVTVDRLRQAMQEARSEVGPGLGGLPGRARGDGDDDRGRERAPGFRGVVGQEAKVVRDYLGITNQELRTQFQAGKSLAQIAVDKGKTAQGLINALVSDANARIDKAVADGKLTAERAAQMKQQVRETITNLVNRTLPQNPAGPGRSGRGGRD